MSKIIFSVLFLAGSFSSAKSESVPMNATQVIFESLAKTIDKNAATKPPMSIEVTNVVCSIGSGQNSKMKCVGEFEIGNKKEKKEIYNSEVFYKYLDAKHGIAQGEIVFGGAHYKTEKLICNYSLETDSYYKCTSDVKVSM